MQKVLYRVTLAGLLAVSLLSLVSVPVRAQGVSTSDLIAAVNALRADYGLAPYQVDGYWMSVAQEHSEYMASIDVLTHTRADGTEPGDHNISSENIGGGYAVTAQFLIDQWSDYWHHFTLIGFSSGLVGAGVAEGEDGYLYYTLVVKNNGELTGLPDAQSTENPASAEQTPQVTVETREPIITATPQEDGSISHQVQVGETLWDIAISYDVNVSDLANLNYLDPEDPVIYPGQTLLVRLGFTPTATGTITNTPLPPTRTLRPSRTPQPARLTETPVPASQETEVPLLPDDPLVNRENINMLGTVTIVVAVMGVGALIFGRIWTKRNR